MSGGHFEYNQHRMTDIATELEEVIANNNVKDEWDYSTDYSEETLKKMAEVKDIVNAAAAMVHKLDWLLSGDSGEESIHSERWDENHHIKKFNETYTKNENS